MTNSELIHSLDCEALLVSLSKGDCLNEEEINAIKDYVQFSLKAPKRKICLEELYSAATVLNKADDPSLAYLLVHFLEFHDPLLVSYALETLICKWHVYEDLHERLVQFALGMPWDKDQDLRESALNSIYYLMRCELNSISEKIKVQYNKLMEEVIKDKGASEEVKCLAEQIKSIF